MQEPQEWWGETKFTPDRGTYYVTSLFIEAVETPRAVVVLDDADRVENPKVLNPLLPLLDDRSKSWVEQVGRYVVVAEGVVFFATVNEGWEYVGSDPLDLALRDRFYEVKLDVPPEEMLAGVIRSKAGVDSGIAAQLAMFVTKARENATMPVMISTRKVLLAAEDVVLGATMRDAILYSIIPGLSIDQQEAILQVLQQSMGETQLRTNDDHGAWRNWK
jgi:nitric oxide reductase NorQ protein